MCKTISQDCNCFYKFVCFSLTSEHSSSKMTQCHQGYTRIGTKSFTKSVSTSSRLRLNTAFICSSETGSLVLSLMLRAAMRNIWQIKKQSINFEWLEPRYYFIRRWNMIIWVSVILNMTVVDNKINDVLTICPGVV